MHSLFRFWGLGAAAPPPAYTTNVTHCMWNVIKIKVSRGQCHKVTGKGCAKNSKHIIFCRCCYYFLTDICLASTPVDAAWHHHRPFTLQKLKKRLRLFWQVLPPWEWIWISRKTCPARLAELFKNMMNFLKTTCIIFSTTAIHLMFCRDVNSF